MQQCGGKLSQQRFKFRSQNDRRHSAPKRIYSKETRKIRARVRCVFGKPQTGKYGRSDRHIEGTFSGICRVVRSVHERDRLLLSEYVRISQRYILPLLRVHVRNFGRIRKAYGYEQDALFHFGISDGNFYTALDRHGA